MTKAESAMAHEKAEVVMLRREGKSDVITLVVESDINEPLPTHATCSQRDATPHAYASG